MGNETSCIRRQTGTVNFEHYTPTKTSGQRRSAKKEKQQWKMEIAEVQMINELNQLTNGDDAKATKDTSEAVPVRKAPAVPLPGKGKVSELRKMYTEMDEKIQDEQKAQWRAKQSPIVNASRDNNEQSEVEYLKGVNLELKREIYELLQVNDRVQKELDSSYATCFKLLLHTDNGSVLMQMKSAYNHEQGRLGNIIGEQRAMIKALKNELNVLKAQKVQKVQKETETPKL